MIIIGFVGKMGSGKTTCTNFLVKDYVGKYDFVKISFADKLKSIVSQIYGIPVSYCYDNKNFEVRGTTIRKLLQKWGNAGRDIDKDTWIFSVREFINSYLIKNRSVVIDDVRMQNEAQFIRNESGFLVKIVRPEIQSNDFDISETEQEHIVADFVLVNDGSLDYLKKKLDLIMKQTNK